MEEKIDNLETNLEVPSRDELIVAKAGTFKGPSRPISKKKHATPQPEIKLTPRVGHDEDLTFWALASCAPWAEVQDQS